MMAVELYYPGLQGVIAGETNICTIEDGCQYRGYAVADLLDGASFLETAYLLLFEELPTQEQMADFLSILCEEAEIPDQIVSLYQHLPLHVSPMEALRTGLSALGHYDPQPDEDSLDAMRSKSIRILARVPLLVGLLAQLRDNRNELEPQLERSYLANLYWLVTGREANCLLERALEATFILSAEHEFTAATFAARVVASTQADPYAAATAAIGAVIGHKHTEAGDRILPILHEVGHPRQAAEYVKQVRQQEGTIPGFGHPVYQEVDPRAALLEAICDELADAVGARQVEETADAVERAVWEEYRQPPNLDWPRTRLYHYLGIAPDFHQPFFSVARLPGWCAHILEQAESGLLIRPRARYRGATGCRFVQINERG